MLRRYGVAALGVLPDAVGGEGRVDESSARFGVDPEGALLRRLAHLLKSSEVPPAHIFCRLLVFVDVVVAVVVGVVIVGKGEQAKQARKRGCASRRFCWGRGGGGA